MATIPIDELFDHIRKGKPDEMIDAYRRILETDRLAVSSLVGATRDGSPLVRWAAVSALGDLGISEGFASLKQALTDEHVSVRVRAAQSLLKLGSQEGIPTLIEALDSKEVMIGHPPELASDYAHQILISFTGQDHGFNGSAPESGRVDAISRWKEWWEDHSA